MKVIVTNAKNRIAYAIARSLAKRNIEVVTADSIPTAMSFSSRYSSSHFIYPSPYTDEKAFIDELIKQCKLRKPDVLIPVYEETFVVAKHKKLLGDYVNLFVPDFDMILAVHDKQNLYKTAETLGIPTPKSISVSDLEKRPQLTASFRYPVLIKPRQGGGAWGIEQVDSEQKLIKIIEQQEYPGNLPGERFVVQEWISGRVSCCGMLTKQGDFRAGCCYRQLRETPLAGGTATYRESINAPDIMVHFQRLLKTLNWDGICQADFIVDDVTGKPYLIDVNPRFWGSLFQTIISGVDFPYLVYQLALGHDFEPQHEYTLNLKSRWIWGDIKCFVEFVRNRSIRPDINAMDFFRLARTDKYDDFEMRDPLPFFMWFADHVYKMAQQKSLHPAPHEEKEGIWE